MSDDKQKLGDEGKEDFEGHRLGDEQLSDQLSDRVDDVGEPDFEGHRLGDEKFSEKLDG
jgi:hypothetical protein